MLPFWSTSTSIHMKSISRATQALSNKPIMTACINDVHVVHVVHVSSERTSKQKWTYPGSIQELWPCPANSIWWVCLRVKISMSLFTAFHGNTFARGKESVPFVPVPFEWGTSNSPSLPWLREYSSFEDAYVSYSDSSWDEFPLWNFSST